MLPLNDHFEAFDLHAGVVDSEAAKNAVGIETIEDVANCIVSETASGRDGSRQYLSGCIGSRRVIGGLDTEAMAERNGECRGTRIGERVGRLPNRGRKSTVGGVAQYVVPFGQCGADTRVEISWQPSELCRCAAGIDGFVAMAGDDQQVGFESRACRIGPSRSTAAAGKVSCRTGLIWR